MTPSLGRRRYPAALLAVATAILVPGLMQLPAVADPDPGPGAPELDLLDPGTAVQTLGDPVAGLANVDTRGVAQPSATQLAAASRLGGASLRWNSFGTPAS